MGDPRGCDWPGHSGDLRVPELREEAKLLVRGSLGDVAVERRPQPALDNCGQHSSGLVGVRACQRVGDHCLLGGGPSSRRVETSNRFLPIGMRHTDIMLATSDRTYVGRGAASLPARNLSDDGFIVSR